MARALASSEIDFHDAYAIPLGPVEKGFNRMMENVIHHSRIALATAVLGFTQRGYRLARVYADGRALTPDQGGSATTPEFCAAVARAL